MTTTENQIAENYCSLLQQIESACARAGRTRSTVKLVAVTKYAELQWVRALLALGVPNLGESRPQQLIDRAAKISEPVNWHLIGHLQRNKARRILPLVTLVHSVDTFRLLATIERLAQELGRRSSVLLEINVTGELQKHGFAPDELLDGWQQVVSCRNVEIKGLMTMAPLSEHPEDARPVFRELRRLRDQLVALSPPSLTLPELSMGMSRDFKVAIEEGATLVRIGSNLLTGLHAGEADEVI